MEEGVRVGLTTVWGDLTDTSVTAAIDGGAGIGQVGGKESEGFPSVVQNSDPEHVVASWHVDEDTAAVLHAGSDFEDVSQVPFGAGVAGLVPSGGGADLGKDASLVGIEDALVNNGILVHVVVIVDATTGVGQLGLRGNVDEVVHRGVQLGDQGLEVGNILGGLGLGKHEEAQHEEGG